MPPGYRAMSHCREIQLTLEHDTNHHVLRVILLSTKHPLLWSHSLLFFTLLVPTLLLELLGFTSVVSWLLLVYLAATVAWIIWFALMILVPGIYSVHLILSRIAGLHLAGIPVGAGPGFLSLCGAPFTVGLGVWISIAVIKKHATPFSLPGRFVTLLPTEPRSYLEALAAFAVVTVILLVALVRVWRYRCSGARYCPICGNGLNNAPSNQCTECGNFQYDLPPGD